MTASCSGKLSVVVEFDDNSTFVCVRFVFLRNRVIVNLCAGLLTAESASIYKAVRIGIGFLFFCKTQTLLST